MEEKTDLNEVVVVDLASIPSGIDIEKWMYLAKTQGIALIDSNQVGHTKPIVKPYMLNSRRKLTLKITEMDNLNNKNGGN